MSEVHFDCLLSNFRNGFDQFALSWIDLIPFKSLTSAFQDLRSDYKEWMDHGKVVSRPFVHYSMIKYIVLLIKNQKAILVTLILLEYLMTFLGCTVIVGVTCMIIRVIWMKQMVVSKGMSGIRAPWWMKTLGMKGYQNKLNRSYLKDQSF